MLPRPLLLAAAATLAAWLPPIVFGLRWPDYRASRDFISELGALGAPDAAAVNLSFVVAGGLLVVTCLSMARLGPGGRRAAALGLLSAVGWSYVMAAFVPCDAGCPAEGSASQMLHNAAGGLAYLAGAVGLLLAAGGRTDAGGPAWLSTGAGIIALASLLGMGAPELADVRGAIQRLGEAAIFTWLLVEAAAMDRARRRAA